LRLFLYIIGHKYLLFFQKKLVYVDSLRKMEANSGKATNVEICKF
jgi:hypothetical protein